MNASTKPATNQPVTKSDEAGKEATAAVSVIHVLDTTTLPTVINDQGKEITGDRVHEIVLDGAVRPYRFQHGKPLALPIAVAVKFLKTPEFKRTDPDGNPIAYKRPPKQPHELQAGEALKLAENETVSRYDELTNAALQQRALEMLGGERFSDKPERQAMIDFIVETKAKLAKLNKSKEADIAPDEFIPPAEFEDAA